MQKEHFKQGFALFLVLIWLLAKCHWNIFYYSKIRIRDKRQSGKFFIFRASEQNSFCKLREFKSIKKNKKNKS